MKHLLVPVDFSDTTGPVVAQATMLARATRATLCLLHAVPPHPDFVGVEAGHEFSRQGRAQHFRDEHRQIQAMTEPLIASGLSAHALLAHGPPVEAILHHARRLPADLIVIGSHGHGALYHLLVGTTAQGVLKHPPCPVLVVPRPAPGSSPCATERE